MFFPLWRLMKLLFEGSFHQNPCGCSISTCSFWSTTLVQKCHVYVRFFLLVWYSFFLETFCFVERRPKTKSIHHQWSCRFQRLPLLRRLLTVFQNVAISDRSLYDWKLYDKLYHPNIPPLFLTAWHSFFSLWFYKWKLTIVYLALHKFKKIEPESSLKWVLLILSCQHSLDQ